MTAVEFTEETQNINFPAEFNSTIEMNQRTARLIAHLFEPNGPDSFVHWGYFDPIFEQKEYAESYVMEPLARKMMEDMTLIEKLHFEEWKKANPEQAKNQWAQLNWFFQKTPYWDSKKMCILWQELWRKEFEYNYFK